MKTVNRLVLTLAVMLFVVGFSALGAQAFMLWSTDKTYMYIFLSGLIFSIAALYFPVRSILDLEKMRRDFLAGEAKVLIVEPPSTAGDGKFWTRPLAPVAMTEASWYPESHAQGESRISRQLFLVPIQSKEQAKKESDRMSHAMHYLYDKLMAEGYRLYSMRDDVDKSILSMSVTPGNRMTHAVGERNRLPTDWELLKLKELVEAEGISFEYDPNTKY